MKTSTLCVQLPPHDDPHGAVAPPIYQTAAFRQPGAREFGEYDYTRTANPTRSLTEQQIAALEGGRFACAFGSGMAALAAVTRLVKAGEEILAGDDLYGGTVRLLSKVAPGLGIGVRHVDASDPAAVEAALTPATRLLLVESPTNPLLRIADLERLAGIAHAHGALLAVDNSLLSPYLQRPLALGADLVIHSATKLLCGHGDVCAGAVVTDDAALHERLAFHLNAEGTGLAPFDSWLLLRGMKTLALRVERQCATAARIAEFLAAHRQVEKVYFPTLAPPCARAVHERQAKGPGQVVSFTTGDPETSRRIVESARLFAIAVSFGSVGSSISLPCRMSHASIPQELRGRLGPPPDLIRLSIGIEDADDLIADLSQALR
ncbi:MAG TPA: PLP-dependent aspartate aminotransferase family protein [Thermoanaerobaculia bacterium]|nr:PLP-dependent aspartate aminotransferase family protein [Thermoanaerobaculia bacterium]